MLVTGLPPSIEGIDILPTVEVGMAGVPSSTWPFKTVYVHVIPLTVSVAAKVESVDMNININPITSLTHFIFIVTILSCFDFSWATMKKRERLAAALFGIVYR